MSEHHENCDSIGLGPDLEPSAKPCNCSGGKCLVNAASALIEYREARIFEELEKVKAFLAAQGGTNERG